MRKQMRAARKNHGRLLSAVLFLTVLVAPFRAFAFDDVGDDYSGFDWDSADWSSTTDDGIDSDGYSDSYYTSGDYDYYTGNYSYGDSRDDGDGGSDEDMSARELAAIYEAARAELEAALEGERAVDPIEYETLLEQCEEAQAALDAYCAEHGYSYTADDYTGLLTVYDAEGGVVRMAGDPVMLATGAFHIDDTDLLITVGKTQFAVTRHYVSNTAVSSEYGGDTFGAGWASLLDSRIIDGFHVGAEDEYKKWDGLVTEGQKSLNKIKGYAQKSSKCNTILRQMQAIYDNRLKNRSSLEYAAYLSSARDSGNYFVKYGYAAYAARSIGTNKIIYVDDYGNPIVFTNSGNSFHNEYYGDRLKITRNSSNDFIVTFASGETRQYNVWGKLESITFPNGGTIRFYYDNLYTLLYVSVNEARTIQFTWSGIRLLSATDGVRTVSYTYEDGRLATVRDADGDVKSFSYDDDGRLSRQIKSDGSYIAIGYARGNDGIVRTAYTIDENGAKETFSYEPSARRTTYTDHDGVQSVFTYDAQRRTVQESYADGRVVSYGYGENGRLAWKESLGMRETYRYDTDNHLIAVLYSDGSSIGQTYAGDVLVSYTDRDGVVTSFDFDERGNCTALYRGGQKVVSYVYNAQNLVTQTEDCRGNTMTYSYDAEGNMLEQKRFAKGTTAPIATETFAYDAIGRVTRATNAVGIVQTYQYEPHQITVNVSNGFETVLRYSSRKDLVFVRQTDTITGEERICRYEYDKAHRCIHSFFSGTDGTGAHYEEQPLQSTVYTAQGNTARHIVWNTAGTHWRTENTYDEAGQVQSRSFAVINTDGSLVGSPDTVSLQYQWTDTGYGIAETNGDGRMIQRFFDMQGRLTEIRDGDYIRNRRVYSAEGRPTQTQVTAGGQLSFLYDAQTGYVSAVAEIDGTVGTTQIQSDADGKKREEIAPDGSKTYYFYDAYGNVTQRVADGVQETWLYDAAGRLVRHDVAESDGTVVAETTCAYSADGRTLTYTRGSRYKIIYRMNGFGEVISITDAAGNARHFVYDVRGNCIAETDAYGNKTQFFYDGKNQLVTVRAANGLVTTYTYDQYGNCTAIANDTGILYTATFDKSGRIISKAQTPLASAETYAYDGNDALVRLTRGDIPVVQTTFSADGRQLTRTDARGARATYTTDGFGRVRTEKNRLHAEQSFTYHADGSLATAVDFNGVRREYTYTRPTHTLAVLYADGTSEEETRDAAGNIVRVRNKNGALQYTYDTAGFLLSQYDTETHERVTYTYDACGRRTRMHSEKQDVQYQYGKNGELTKITDTMNDQSVQFVYDAQGNETLRVYATGESVQSFYDKAGRLLLSVGYSPSLAVVWVDGAVYDERGFQTLSLQQNLSVTRYTYDEQGRLDSVQHPYDESLIAYWKRMLAEAGVPLSEAQSHASLTVTAAEYAALKTLCAHIGAGTYQPQLHAAVLEERFAYDANGNMTRRQTPFGTITYTYDAEDRLIAWGEGCVAQYDANGNLLQKQTRYAQSVFSYTATNRMSGAIVNDMLSSEQTVYECAYDAFGRRQFIAAAGIGSVRTVFDGLSFNDLYAVREQAASVHDTAAEPRFRYLYLGDDAMDTRYRADAARTKISADASSAVSLDNGYVALYGTARTPLALTQLSTATPVRCALFSDRRGSLATVHAAEEGTALSRTYDVFGAPLSEPDAHIPFGFAGKKTLFGAPLYDFGYRDYDPAVARFTTVDPARDGTHWYAYCAGDPVNFVDMLGLRNVRPNDTNMRDAAWSNELLGQQDIAKVVQHNHDTITGKIGDSLRTVWLQGKTFTDYTTIGTDGCVVSGLAEVINVLTNSHLTPKDINDVKTNFVKNTDLIDFVAVAQEYGLAHTYWTQAVQGNLGTKINELNASATQYGLLIEVYYSGSHTHWVGVDGGVVVLADGNSYVAISKTSVNDGRLAGGRVAAGWKSENGKIYVPTENIKTIQQFWNPDAVVISTKNQ